MNANEVIESYVRDVASCLPRNKRNDVAFELRALLADELAAKAHAEGRAPDKAMAMQLLKGFGRPADAAALVFVSPQANETAAPIFGAVAALMVLSAFYEMYREWARISPAPMLAPGRA